MAFQATNTGQESKNRKILEQLEEQKKRLKMQAQGISSTFQAQTPVASHAVPASQSQVQADAIHMTPAQRTALQHAQANSVGYFITQDSSFGNLILPVLPRLDKGS